MSDIWEGGGLLCQWQLRHRLKAARAVCAQYLIRLYIGIFEREQQQVFGQH